MCIVNKQKNLFINKVMEYPKQLSIDKAQHLI